MSANSSSIDDIDGRCNCFAVRKAARYLSAAYDKALAPAGLRATQFSILHKLAKNSPMTIKRLAGLMAMDRTTMATNLKPLERQGLIVTGTADDRRARKIEITAAGRQAVEQALPLWLAVQDRFEAAFGTAEATELRRMLDEVLGTGFEPWAE
jgi:DNA-binding MarR family transcriptional regulator